MAAATERILLGTAVLLLPNHHPVVLAKRLATIDVLSRAASTGATSVGRAALSRHKPVEVHAHGALAAGRLDEELLVAANTVTSDDTHG